jgi:hypothetical protein
MANETMYSRFYVRKRLHERMRVGARSLQTPKLELTESITASLALDMQHVSSASFMHALRLKRQKSSSLSNQQAKGH